MTLRDHATMAPDVPSELIGRVESFDGQYFCIVCENQNALPGYLRWHSFIRSQMKDAQVGDRVKLRFYSNRSRGYWYVAEVLR